jgi:hypothetical protein
VKAFYFARLATAGGAIALAYITPALAADNLPIRIGWLSSLTGPLSSAAIAENQGVGLQSTQINGAEASMGASSSFSPTIRRVTRPRP